MSPFGGQIWVGNIFLSEYSLVRCLNCRNGTPWSFNATAAVLRPSIWKKTAKNWFGPLFHKKMVFIVFFQLVVKYAVALNDQGVPFRQFRHPTWPYYDKKYFPPKFGLQKGTFWAKTKTDFHEIFRLLENVQIFERFSDFWKKYIFRKIFRFGRSVSVRSCLLITLIKCLNGRKSLGLLFVCQK